MRLNKLVNNIFKQTITKHKRKMIYFRINSHMNVRRHEYITREMSSIKRKKSVILKQLVFLGGERSGERGGGGRERGERGRKREQYRMTQWQIDILLI